MACTGSAETTDVHCLLVLTTACDVEDECLSLSNERYENSGGVPISTDFLPCCTDSKLEFPSVSELHDSRGLDMPVSELLYNEGNKRSTLGLPELIKDMSLSGTEVSTYDLPL